ncbi:MEDS: MEthanogen/methylotroph, DcmR Sensory domain [Kutzneria sp. CA-103260]|nr:MEDS: MEthanogen/methylotroph, DcmR Sensory domain [Kutzneria sp. CA-103260]
MAFTDVEARWQVLTAYTRTGLAQAEKVLLILAPGDLDDDVVARMDGSSDHVKEAHDSGQLTIERNTSMYLPDGSFDTERQLETYVTERDRASSDGWSGIRVAADMSWALQPGVDSEEIVNYEASLGPLFADRRFVAICWYDQRLFREHVVAATRAVHPIQVMERLDAIDVTRTQDGSRIAGSAELSTRGDFVDALREALKQPDAREPFHFELDLTDLCFMEAHCAWQLISFAAALPERSKVTLRCGPLLELVLRGLGAATVPQLELSVAEDL